MTTEPTTEERPWAGTQQHVMIVVLVCMVAVVGGWLLKGQCLQPWANGHQMSSLCYNDIQPLYGGRGIQQGIFPYIHGSLDQTNQPVNGAIEYPVLTGVFMWFTGRFAHDANRYLQVSALFLAPFALFVAFMLARMRGLRALMWAAAPAIVLYSFHNWDLLVVAAAVGGFYMWYRGHPLWAAVLFGIGGALKVYPLFFLLPLVFEKLFQKDYRRAVGTLGAGGLTFALINLPFALIHFDGWWATYKFHELRGPNYDDIWPVLFPHIAGNVSELNKVSGILTIVTFGLVLAVAWWRAKGAGTYPFVNASAALLCTFLLFNKVHSPQYTLWLVPFFVLVEAPLFVTVGLWFAYSLADLLVYVGIFKFFASFAGGPHGGFYEILYQDGVMARAALLIVLIAFFLAAKPGLEVPETAPVVDERAKLSHGTTTVAETG